MAYAALEAGLRTHRFNMRGCGGTEALALSELSLRPNQRCSARDARAKTRERAADLPGRVLAWAATLSLKLAGELGESGPELLAGVCAVSTPIDLAASAPTRSASRENSSTNVASSTRLKETDSHPPPPGPRNLHARTSDRKSAPSTISTTTTPPVCSASARPPTTIAPNPPISSSKRSAFRPCWSRPKTIPWSRSASTITRRFARTLLRLVAVDHGGHLGFLARRRPRFWLDGWS